MRHDLLGLAQLLDVEHVECFAPVDGRTHCNGYAKVFCAALGLELPAMKANDLHAWLSEPAHGWARTDAITAAHLAWEGQPVLAAWLNPTGGHGHIAVVVPGPTEGHLFVSAAGSHNYVAAPLEKSFGLSLHPDFFTYLEST